LPTRQGRKQNNESYVKCAVVYTFTLVERKTSSLYDQLPRTVNREAETAQTVTFRNNMHKVCDVTDKRRCRQRDRLCSWRCSGAQLFSTSACSLHPVTKGPQWTHKVSDTLCALYGIHIRALTDKITEIQLMQYSINFIQLKN